MINLEIVDSPDENVVTSFNFYNNQIYIGRDSGDLHINDPELLKNHVMLETIENELFIHPQKHVVFFLINGKRATTLRKLKISDKIKLGKTTILIKSFKETYRKTKKQILNERLNQLIESDSPLLPIIESLNKLLKS